MKILKGSIILVFSAISVLVPTFVMAEVTGRVYQSLALDKEPLDIALSPDEAKIFVLTAGGEILIYSLEGELQDRLTVDRSYDRIEILPGGLGAVLSSSKDKTVDIFFMEFIHDLDFSGSPSKGPADAPVTIAIFADFQ